MEEKNYCVYVHTNLKNNKKYVGITKQKPSKRWRKGEGYKNNTHFYNSINKYGWDNFDSQIIKKELTVQEAKNIEVELIKLYSSNNYKHGYNKTKGGDSTYEITDETRKKLSESHKGLIDGDKNPMYGKSLRDFVSDEEFEQFREKQRMAYELRRHEFERPIYCVTTGETFNSIKSAGEKYSIQESDISNCCAGRLYSEGRHPELDVEMVWQHLKDYKNGIKPKEKYLRIAKVICVNTLEIFDGSKQASKKYGVPASNITLCCQGKFNRAGRMPITNEKIAWQYLKDYENGVKIQDEINNGIKVRCLNTNQVFNSIKEAVKNFRYISTRGVKMCCDGLQKYSGKLLDSDERLAWEYV
jgi:hypothetical protein